MASEHQQTIDRILDRWEVARAEGRYVTPRELCTDQPELLGKVNEYVAALEWVQRKEQMFFSDSEQPFAGTGRRISRYELLEVVGAGGFGTVWKAFDSELQREVAIKLPRQIRFESDSQRNAFFAEARNLAKLDHPNIISVYDIGQDEDQVFLVSQLVDGLTLAEMIARGNLTLERSIEIVQAVADALTCAHSQDVIHRDVKPGNILVSNDGQVLLGDFGISSSGSQPTTDNRGTYSYMSPEQLVPNGPVDLRSDIFSLGVVAYQLATGELPFLRNKQGVRERGSIIEPATLNSDIPKRISSAIKKSLSIEPADRFQSAGEMSAAFHIPKPNRRRAFLAVAAGLTVLALGSVVGWNWLLNVMDRYERFDPLAHYSFNDLTIPLANGGRDPQFELVVRGDVKFETASTADVPSIEAGGVAHLTTYKTTDNVQFGTNAGFELNKSALASSAAFTISMWFYRENNNNLDTLLHLGESSGFGEQSTPQLTIWIDEQDQLRLLSYHRFGHVQAKKPELNESLEVADLTGKWCNLTMTFETQGHLPTEGPGRFRAFVNGKLVVERDNTHFAPVLNNSKSRLSFGRTLKRSRTRVPKGLDGAIGDIKIWNRALRENEIANQAAHRAR